MEQITQNSFFLPVFKIIENLGIENFINTSKEKDIITFKYSLEESYKFELIFWIDDNRISFNIKDWYEILDECIKNEQEAIEVFEFIETILKNQVLFSEFSIKNKNTIYKKSIEYTSIVNRRKELIKQDSILKFKFPWQKYKLINKIIYNPILK